MTSVFTYSEYESDYAQKFLRDNGDGLPEWFKDYLNGQSVTSQNRDDDIEDYLAQNAVVPSIGVIRSVATNVANATLTALPFEGISFQSTSEFDWAIGDPTKVTLEERGICLIIGNAYFDGSTVGVYRTAQLYQNGVTELAAMTIPPLSSAANPPRVSVSVVANLEAGDFCQLMVNQDSGGNLPVAGRLSISYLGLSG